MLAVGKQGGHDKGKCWDGFSVSHHFFLGVILDLYCICIMSIARSVGADARVCGLEYMKRHKYIVCVVDIFYFYS